MPLLRNWKSEKLFNLSKVYLDQSIENESDLLKDGIRKARIASLLAPKDGAKKENYLQLLYRLEPIQAIVFWSDESPHLAQYNEKKKALIKKCLHTLRNQNLSKHEKIIAGKIALNHLSYLEKEEVWFKNPDNCLLSSNILAQVGNIAKAKEIISKSLENHPTHVESVFFLVRVIVHLNDSQSLPSIGRQLAILSKRGNITGKEAIRHMTLLHLLQPLSLDSLEQCIDLLKLNTYSEPIDFLRIYALKYELLNDANQKDFLIEEATELFNLEDSKEHLVFCNWLNVIGAYDYLLNFASVSKAKTDKDLFQLRMNALINTNDLEGIHFEINNSPMIPIIWRLVIEARVHSIQENYYESEKILNRLLLAIGNDPRKIRSICQYLEFTKDIRGLSHILEHLIEHPIHQTFALKKLIQHRSSSASLEELILWMNKLTNTGLDDSAFAHSFLYFELLDPNLPTPSKKLNSLLQEAQKVYNLNNASFESKIILALAHLRNQEPDRAIVAIGPTRDWRLWRATRPAWSFIASQVFKLNNETEKYLLLKTNLNLNSLSRAEAESFEILFPESFN